MARLTFTYQDDEENVITRTARFVDEGNNSFQAAEALHEALVLLNKLVSLIGGDPFRDCIGSTKSSDIRAKLAAIDNQQPPEKRVSINNEGWNSHGYWVGSNREPRVDEVTNYPSRARCGGPKMCRTCGWTATTFPAFIQFSKTIEE